MTHQALLNMTYTSLPVSIVLIAFGLANCFFGYRLFRVWLGIWGFIGGGAASMSLLRVMDMEPTLQLLGVLLGGIIGAVLVSILYNVGVFLFGAGFGLLAAVTIQQHISTQPIWPFMIILGIAGGVAALALQRPLITLFSAIGGAWIAIATIGALITGCVPSEFPARCPRAAPWALLVLGAWLLLGIFGLAAQMRQARGRKRFEKEDE
jgi:hypothetical protein